MLMSAAKLILTVSSLFAPSRVVLAVNTPVLSAWRFEMLCAVLSAACLLTGFIVFILYGIDKKKSITFQALPPEGMTPAEAAYILKGRAEAADLIPLLLYWADQGYIAIQENQGAFVFQKQKEPGAKARPYEKRLFHKLFKNSAQVNAAALSRTLKAEYASFCALLREYFQKEETRLFTRQSTRMRPLFAILAAIPVFCVLGRSLYYDPMGLAFCLIMAVVLGFAILLPFYYLVRLLRGWHYERAAVRRIKLYSAIFLCALSFGIFLLLTLLNGQNALLPLLAAASTSLLGLMAIFMHKHTPQGAAWARQLLGLKSHIRKAPAQALEQHAAQDPAYFYKILPFAAVFSLTGEWAGRFEDIKPPSWYSGAATAVFSAAVFLEALLSALNF